MTPDQAKEHRHEFPTREQVITYAKADVEANASRIGWFAYTKVCRFLLEEVARTEQLEKENQTLRAGFAVAEQEFHLSTVRALKLKDALQTLRNETKGLLRAHEMAIRIDHGNSNANCLEMALTKADEALK